MAKADRTITLTELLQGNFTEEYLDKKEKKAILKRRLEKYSVDRDFLETKIEIVGEREDLIKECNKLNKKIEKTLAEYKQINI